MLLRIIHRLKSGGDKEMVELPNGKKRSYEDLMSHHEEMLRNSEKRDLANGILYILQTMISQVKHKNCEINDCTRCTVESFCNVNDILKIVGKNLINSHGIGEKYAFLK